jgi:hypothetical protein
VLETSLVAPMSFVILHPKADVILHLRADVLDVNAVPNPRYHLGAILFATDFATELAGSGWQVTKSLLL